MKFLVSLFAVLLLGVCVSLPNVSFAQVDAEREQRQEDVGDGESRKAATAPKGFRCGGKTKCAQMSGCAEARFYLEECGLRRLDRDNDGVPCESICQ